MRYTFGPVPSRRLGQSLGIDPLPLKTCNWNCVYCQLGRTVPLTNACKEYVPRRAILAEAREALASHGSGGIDWITFVGSGETTLYSGLGWLVRKLKTLTSLPVAVITNGSLLYLARVRKSLACADLVMPSLDAGNPETYRKINRPWPGLRFERFVDGLVKFRREFHGILWLEVMLVRDLNDGVESLQQIAAIIRQIQPDRVHINLPTRPPAETWVRPPGAAVLQRAREIIGDSARVVGPPRGEFSLEADGSLAEGILAIITRHPATVEDLARGTGYSPEAVHGALQELAANRRVSTVVRFGRSFWVAASTHFSRR